MYKVYFGHNMVLITDKSKWKDTFTNGLLFYCEPDEDLTYLMSHLERSKALNKVYILGDNEDSTYNLFKNCFTNIEAAGGLVRNSKGEYLIIKRRGKWDLPKGKIEDFEQCFDAAIRETMEETGLFPLDIISILPPTYHVYLQDGKQMLKKTYWYEMSYTGKDTPAPQHSEGITVARWFRKDELPYVLENTYLSVIDVLNSMDLLKS